MDKNLEYKLSLKDQFSKTMQGAVNSTSKLDSKMTSLNDKGTAMSSGFGRLGGVIAGAFSVAAVTSFGKAVIDSYSNFEYFHASLKTMFKGDEVAATALEKKLITLAKTTPFELTEVQTATKQLLAYGFKAGDVVNTMRTLGDVSAGIGAPLGDIAYLYGTLKTSGRVTLMDLRQFAGRGIPIYETLAKRLNTTTDNINKMVSSGKIGFKDIEGAFGDMTQKGGQFFNLMDDQSKTLGGQISNLSDSWDQFKVSIGTTLSENLKSTFSFLSSSLSAINDQLMRSNTLQQSLTKAGVGLKFGEVTAGGVLSDFQSQLDKISNDASISAQGKIVEFQKLSANLAVKQKMGTVLGKNDAESNEMFLRKIELVKTQLNLQKGEQRLSSSTDEKKTLSSGIDANGEPKDKTSKSLGTGTEVTGNRPQSLNITINDGLVKEMTISTTNMSEGSQKIKEMVSKALLEAVNDVNLMER